MLKTDKACNAELSNYQFMKPDVVLDVNSVSKKFARSLKSSLKYGAKDLVRSAFGLSVNERGLRPGEFWALKDVSFDLKKGESLGLLGLNGSGKSSLLKLISGIYLPEQGEVKIAGRVGALIELGAGFHPQLTGKENIYTKSALLGLSRKEVDLIFDDIVEFAEIGKFIDSPVKTYSSGMYLRLAFAVAININPDILLVDEVLAVGDFLFRQKCLEKINEMKGRMSVILVSHSMRDITLFCDRAIVLDKGRILYMSKPDDAVRYYLESIKDRAEKKNKVKHAIKEKPKKPYMGEFFYNRNKIVDVVTRWLNGSGYPVSSVKHGDSITIEFSFKLLSVPKNLVIGVPMWNQNGHQITGISTDMRNLKITVPEDGVVKGRLTIDPVTFNSGKYFSTFNIRDGAEFYYRNENEPFYVDELPICYGYLTPTHSWEFNVE